MPAAPEASSSAASEGGPGAVGEAGKHARVATLRRSNGEALESRSEEGSPEPKAIRAVGAGWDSVGLRYAPASLLPASPDEGTRAASGEEKEDIFP